MADPSGEFDLLDEPWIGVVANGGTRREVGILEAIRDAHHIREVIDPSPLSTCGIYRLLFAILHRYQPFPDGDDAWLDAWAEEWQRGRFSEDLAAQIAENCAGRFGLFDPVHPFFQSVGAPAYPNPSGLKTVGYLFLEESTGTNVAHFSHRGDAAHACCPACCARGLMALPSFAISGGAGIKPSINGTPPIYVMPAGRNLFETLVLNHLGHEFLPKIAATADPGPIWEQSGVIEGKVEKTRVGFLESLTWPARRIHLYPESGGICSHCGLGSEILVRRMVYSQGWSRPKESPAWDDPWIALRVPSREPTVDPKPVVPREDRGVWRDFTSLFGATNQSHNGRARRPASLAQVDRLFRDELLTRDEPVHYETFALQTDGKAKVFEWRQDGFIFPVALLSSREAGAAIDVALVQAEEGSRVLGSALRKLHPMLARKGSDPLAVRKLLNGLVVRARRAYWSDLESAFRLLLGDPRLLGSFSDRQAWLDDWRDTIRADANKEFEREIEGFAFGIEEIRRQVMARRTLWTGLNQALGAAPGQTSATLTT